MSLCHPVCGARWKDLFERNTAYDLGVEVGVASACFTWCCDLSCAVWCAGAKFGWRGSGRETKEALVQIKYIVELCPVVCVPLRLWCVNADFNSHLKQLTDTRTNCYFSKCSIPISTPVLFRKLPPPPPLSSLHFSALPSLPLRDGGEHRGR